MSDSPYKVLLDSNKLYKLLSSYKDGFVLQSLLSTYLNIMNDKFAYRRKTTGLSEKVNLLRGSK